MRSLRTKEFRRQYAALPTEVQRKADTAYQLFRQNPSHPSLHFKRVGDGSPEMWSVRVDRGYRALGLRSAETIAWVWIGTHSDYEKRIY